MTLYSRPSCAPCATLKKYLDHKGVQYDVKNVDEPENYQELTQYATTVPVLVKDPEHYVVGLNLSAVAALI